jgi:hypothetical protein
MNLHSEQINEISTALSKAQGEIKAAQKDGTNPHFKSKFSTLHSHWEACRPILSKNGLAVTQLANMLEDGRDVLVTILSHSSGQWFKSSMVLKPVKNDPQGMGSCLSYARRYMLSAIVGTTSDDDDDDAEAASGRGKDTKPVPKPAKVEASPEAIKIVDANQALELLTLRLKLDSPDRKLFDDWVVKTYMINSLEYLPESGYDKVLLILRKKVPNEDN